ncbi:hypothetical protein GCM10007388_09350 [Pseudoduganella plicata]|uniref:Uncharacterized protein n=1 Tax=Pseudoduganella plicata TaxID=321984 RepID=A0AA88C6Y0_9BURK|nr:hypothetical protein GCM10007388_09350 [Pseudoduganella plicata]
MRTKQTAKHLGNYADTDADKEEQKYGEVIFEVHGRITAVVERSVRRVLHRQAQPTLDPNQTLRPGSNDTSS